MYAVTAGFGPYQHYGAASLTSYRKGQLIPVCQADTHGIDQGVAAVRGIEVYFPSYRGDSDTVAIIADAFNYPRQKKPLPALPPVARSAESSNKSYRSGPHGEYIPYDAAHAGSRP